MYLTAIFPRLRLVKMGETMSLRTEIAKIIIGLAEYYEKELTETQLAMYIEDLLELSPQDLLRAVRLYRNHSNHDRFPLPNKLKAMIEPPIDQRARDAVARILTAISRIGPYRSSEAKEFIGELGWEIVKLQGGWEELCTSLNDNNKPNLQAQWRELGITLINKEKMGLTNEKPVLSFKPKQNGQLENIGKLFDARSIKQ